MDEAATLSAIDAARLTARSNARSPRFALFVFGLISIASAPFYWTLDGGGVGIFWAIAGPLGGMFVGFREQSKRRAIGVRVSPKPVIAITVAMTLGCFGTGMGGGISGHPTLAVLGPALSISLGYFGYGTFSRSNRLRATSIVLGVVSVLLAVAIDNAQTLGSVISVVFGTAFLATGYFMEVGQRGN